MAVALTSVALMAARWTRPTIDLVTLALFVALPSLLGFRVLKVLAELERQRTEPDAAMVQLFDVLLMLPVISVIFATFVMHIVH
jgi:hypothetical protein